MQFVKVLLNSINAMLEFVSTLTFYVAPVIFCPIDWHLCIRHFEKRKFILTFALSFLLNYLCFWCLHSIRMSSFVPVTTFNDDLTIKNQTLRHIFKKTETLMSVLLNLTPAARGFFIGQGQTQLININISLFTNWQGGGTNCCLNLERPFFLIDILPLR